MSGAAARTSTLPVIMFTARGLDEDKVKGLNAGADDYVTKPFSPRELVARIQCGCCVAKSHERSGRSRKTLGLQSRIDEATGMQVLVA